MFSEAILNIGTHEIIDYEDECKLIDFKDVFLEFSKMAAYKKYRTYYLNGNFEGFLVPHEETITIVKAFFVN